MKTRFGSLIVLAALSASGCKMCCPSYDYCSPTNPGASQSEWCGKERRGSIFTGYSGVGEQVMPGETITEEPSDSPAPAVPEPAIESQPTTQPMGFSRNVSNTNGSARRGR